MSAASQVAKAPQGAVFMGAWSGIDGIKGEFFKEKWGYDANDDYVELPPDVSSDTAFEGVNVLFAIYDCGNYSGQAFILFEKAGQLYEVNGSHCSCYGLEDQWEPEETTIEALRHRIAEGNLGNADCEEEEYPYRMPFAKELLALLETLA